MPATKRKIDFTNVKEAGMFRPRRKPEGDYAGKVVKVEDHQFKDDEKEGWVFTITIEGDARSTYPVYVSTSEKEAWKIRKMFIAAGMKVPKSLVMVDPNKLLNKKLGITLEDDEYQGRMKSSVADFLPLDDVQPNDDEIDEVEDEEEVEEPRPRKGTRNRTMTPEDDDDEEDDEAPSPRKRTTRKTTRRAPEPEDDDEEEEEPAPRRRKTTKKAAPRRRVPADDEDDIEDLELEEI